MAETARPSKRVFTLPSGVPFLRSVAEALGDGRLLPGFRLDPTDPLALAGVTIYVPTRRSVRVLRSEFVDLMGGRAAILPLIRPLGEADDDIGFLDPEDPAILDLAEPLGNVQRLLELARLILAWRNRLPQAILDLHGDSPLVAPASPADAVWLARDLSSLIDQLETEDLDWDRLEQLSVGDYSHWWQLSAEFLGVASRFWPARLSELGRSSPARYRNALLRLEARRLAGRTEGPVIVAGSTGSLAAAADLIDTVAALPQGAVVLPGLDRAISDAEFAAVAPFPAPGERDDPAWRCHPQFGMARLLTRMGLTREDVSVLSPAPEELACRARVLSAAMAPAAATDSWSRWRAETDPADIEAAFRDVALIEAASEREEALAIATALKLALSEDPDGLSRAALITPDRNLARRVVAELARFGVTADDTAGMPLASTTAGTLLLLLVEAVLRPGDPVAVAGLLKHPLARFGLPAARYDAAVRALELFALRGRTDPVDLSTLSPLLAAGIAAHRAERHPAPWRSAVSGEALSDAADLAERIRGAVEPLATLLFDGPAAGPRQKWPVDAWASCSGRVLESVARGEDDSLEALWDSEAGTSLAALLAGIIESGDILEADGPQWIDILRAFMAGEKVKPAALGNPRVFIFGTLEARLQSVETMVLGGLNEGNWPGAAESNPFLSRLMKTEIGLEPPERRVGQLAHDFEMANGTRRLIYTRSLRQGTAPTVPSRWLQRLLALAGDGLAADLRARGAPYLAMARGIDRSAATPPARRPAPKPDPALQPQTYSFSETGRLRRDPYAIYARRILRLLPLDPFNADPGARERGTLYHRIVERCLKERAFDEASLLGIVEAEFDAAGLPLHVETVWRPRAREMARAFLRFERDRQPQLIQSFTEVPARFPLTPTLSVTGIADRIDLRADGKVDLVDYKTGSSPTPAQARALLDPQLPLEAAAMAAGAFWGVPAGAVDDLLYVRLKPGARFKTETVNNEKSRSKEPVSAGELGARATGELVRFVETLARGEQGFMSRLIPESDRSYGGEYDHLARVAEWSVAEEGEDGAEESGDDA